MSRGNSYLFSCLFMWSFFVQVHGEKQTRKKRGRRGIRARDLEKAKNFKLLYIGHNYLCFLSVYRISVRTGTVGKTDKKNRQEKRGRRLLV